MTCATTRAGQAARVSARLLGMLLVVLGIGSVLATPGEAQADAEPVPVVQITGEIDLGLAPYLSRTLDDAADDGAPAAIVRINTPGGRLDAALEMRDTLLRAPLPTVAYIDRDALSAGALIALATEEIHMAPGAVIGAATPVTGEGIPADAKVISATRSVFGATAEERGRDPAIAEAMVDPDLEVADVVASGELLTLSASEALDVGYAEGTAGDLEEVLAAIGLEGRTLTDTSPGLAEGLVRFITNPILASLLMMIGVWLIVGDLLSGGVGIGLAVGGALLGVFFWGHLLAGLAGWEDIALVVLGVALLLVEIFVLPGFGIAGFLGLVSLAGGTFLAMLNRDLDFVPAGDMVNTGVLVGITFLGVVVLTVVWLAHLGRRGGPDGLVLRSRLGTGQPVTERSSSGWLRWFGDGGRLEPARPRVREADVPAPTDASAPTDAPAPTDPAATVAKDARWRDLAGDDATTLVGAVGTTLTDLRPAGLAEIDGRRVDVVTEGEYLAAGESVEVLRDEGYRTVVRRVRD